MWFRSVLFVIGYALIMFCVSFSGSILGAFLPLKARFFFPKAAFYGTAFWLRVTCGVKHEIIGRENLPAEACVVASNHQSAWETYALQTLFAPVCTVLKRELLWIPFFGWSLALTRPIAINRSQKIGASKKVIKTGILRLHSRISVLIFPEGTRVKAGANAPFKKSAALLAHSAGASVLPIAHNAGLCWAAHEFLKRRGTITLKIGKPISVVGKTVDQVHEELEKWVSAEMRGLLGT